MLSPGSIALGYDSQWLRRKFRSQCQASLIWFLVIVCTQAPFLVPSALGSSVVICSRHCSYYCCPSAVAQPCSGDHSGSEWWWVGSRWIYLMAEMSHRLITIEEILCRTAASRQLQRISLDLELIFCLRMHCRLIKSSFHYDRFLSLLLE